MHMNDLSELIERLANNDGGRILCVGDLMLDRFIQGDVSRISPEAPIPVLAVRDETVMVGGAGNVVRNLVAMGVETELVAVVGDDAAGRELRSLLDAEALASTRLIETPGRGTTIKTRFAASGQQLLRADRESTGPLDKVAKQALLDQAMKSLQTCAVMILSDYGKGVFARHGVGQALKSNDREGGAGREVHASRANKADGKRDRHADGGYREKRRDSDGSNDQGVVHD